MADERCPVCQRPIWDGGHGLNERECSRMNGIECLIAQRALKAEQERDDYEEAMRHAVRDLMPAKAALADRDQQITALKETITKLRQARVTALKMCEECVYCTSQPFDAGPGCSCSHAPCVHDHNGSVAVKHEAEVVEQVAAWLCDAASLATGENRQVWLDTADDLRSGAWRNP